MLADFKSYSVKLGDSTTIIEKPMIMGILNTTSDSFFDGGKYHTIETALRRCEQMLTEGADIIDIGGQSTRPGAQLTDTELELEKTIPVIEAIIKRFPETTISIDTFRARVAGAAVEAGAKIINDVSAGEDDPAMIELVARYQVPFIAMHKKGKPQNMQNNPQYDDVVKELLSYFEQKIAQLEKAGIKDIILDPGFGFGKTLEHNYGIMKHLGDFHQFNKPLLVGISRKTMIWKLLKTNPEGALNGTTALNTIALMAGAHIIRVHDVKEAAECRSIVEALRG
ncbi:MAG: dihydropteroate synthase [Chitinophagaceae bacterium]